MRAVLGSSTILDQQLRDDVLMTRIVQGDVSALEMLYDRHAPTVFGIALNITGDRALAEEVLQETFWEVWQRAATGQSRSFPGWLFRIVRRLAMQAADTVPVAKDH
jgi:RNA polymerase sigma-70 factor (ECF subfamily)